MYEVVANWRMQFVRQKQPFLVLLQSGDLYDR